MLKRRASLAIAAALVLGSGAARADNLAAFNAAIEDIEAHNRVALGYLHDDNFDLAAVEIERMKEAWSAFAQHFSGDRPDQLRDSKLYVTMLVDVPTRLVTATIMINFGRPDVARSALESIRQEFSAVRRAGGVEVLADCVLDADAATKALPDYRGQPPDWDKPETARDLAAKAETLGAAVKRCDRMAPAAVHDDAEFRRLVDGIAASLAALPEAVAARDAGALERILNALRSFDQRLTLRYG